MPPINPEELHQFLTQHPIGRAIAAHTGYGPGHPVHDAHHRAVSRRPVGPGQTTPTSAAPMPGPGLPMGQPGLPPLPMGGPGPQATPPPSMPMQSPAGRPPLPPQGAIPQGPPR